jgi:hypothetical protein
MFLLVGVSMLLWTSIGRFAEKDSPKVRLRCHYYKRARLSLLRIGILFWRKFTEKIKLTTKFIKPAAEGQIISLARCCSAKVISAQI